MWKLLLLGVLGASSTEPRQPAQEGVIDPKADQVLRRMSDHLAGLKSFQVETTTIDEKFTADGQKVQELAQSTVTVRRPGELRVDRVGPRGHAVFRDDGRQLSLYHRERNLFATAPAPATINDAVDEAREKLKIDAPGGDLIVSDPYSDLTEGMVTGRYIGLEPIGGVMAHHLAVSKQDLDWQIWIKDGPEAVPLRYVITSKDLPGQPEFTIELHDWQPNARVSRDDFAFSPPAGARRIQFSKPAEERP
jgi:hypothetical protein